MESKLAAICSEYGTLHLFLKERDDEDLAHGLYRYIVEDLYDNEEARCADNFGNGVIAREISEELQSGWEQEGESGKGPFG